MLGLTVKRTVLLLARSFLLFAFVAIKTPIPFATVCNVPNPFTYVSERQVITSRRASDELDRFRQGAVKNSLVRGLGGHGSP
jgi:hypothetical protein